MASWLFLLALGDTGHVGFRVIAFGLGDLETAIPVGSFSLHLVGAGSAATAITITILYMLMAEAWRVRNKEKKNWLYWLIMILAVGRFAIMAFPGNSWNDIVPPYSWSLARNIPLTALGIIIAYLFLSWGRKKNDRFQKTIAVCILFSFGFYLPVILFVQQLPLLGMLMIPKTAAYLFMAWITKRELFSSNSSLN